MLRYLKTELKKILPYRPTWIFLGLYMLLIPSVFGVFKSTRTNGIAFDPDQIYSFPEIWTNLTYFASFFHVIPAFLIILLTANEYTYKTLRQNIISGLSRTEFIIGKLEVISIMSLLLAFYIFIVGFIYGFAYTGQVSIELFLRKLYFVPLFALQIMAYMSMAFLIAILIKRSAISLIVYIFYNLLIERILRSKLPDNISIYFPSKSIGDLLPFPAKGFAALMGVKWEENTLPVAIGLSAFYCILFIYLSLLTLRKRDI